MWLIISQEEKLLGSINEEIQAICESLKMYQTIEIYTTLNTDLVDSINEFERNPNSEYCNRDVPNAG